MTGGWLTCKKNTDVTYVWSYDTVAILDEYDDNIAGVLPKGEQVKVSEASTCEGKIMLDLKNHKKLKTTQIPKKRIHEGFLFCTATPLQAVVSKELFESNFEKQ